MPEKTIHLGKKVKRIRETLGIKQEGLAVAMGAGWNQQQISLLEGKENIDDAILEEVAKALKVSAEAIKNFDEDVVFSFINNFADNSVNHGPLNNYHCTFDPIDKITELYERLLKEKTEEIKTLQAQLNQLCSKDKQ